MESAIVLSADDVKTILAEHFEVDEKDVFRSQYSYVVKNVKCDKLIKDPQAYDNNNEPTVR